MKQVHVAVGIIVFNDNFFLTKRHINAHQGGKWEFPGGKVEVGETVAQTLFRELKEEIGIEVLSCQPFLKIPHDYGDKQILLDVFIVDNYNGEPSPQEGQQGDWFSLAQLQNIDFPKANQLIVATLNARADDL
jgi:8-oxo-dGTP diphosphatase